MSDITRVIEQTHREIGSKRTAVSQATGTVLLRRRYDAPIEDVWHACTGPDRLKRWFLPATGELRLDAPEEGETVLEIEHAGISGDFFEGVGAGWDPALWALELHGTSCPTTSPIGGGPARCPPRSRSSCSDPPRNGGP